MTRTKSISNRGAKRRLRLSFIGILAFIVWAGLQLWDQNLSLAEKKSEMESLQKEVTAVKSENEDLQLEVKRLDDEEYIAELARKYYYLSKPGEYIFITPKQED